MIQNIFDWCYGFKSDWNRLEFAHESGTVVASHVKEIDGGSYTRSYNVRLTSGETGTATSEHATTISVQEFWLKTPSGERHVKVQGEYNPVWGGNPVTLIWYGPSLIAYINLKTRRELIIPGSLDEAAGRPSLGGHFLLCFLLVPIALLPLVLVGRFLYAVGLTPLHWLLGLVFTTIIYANALWALFGYPVLFFFFTQRRGALRSRIEQKIRTVVNYR